MLLRIDRYGDLDERKLMDVYAESNFDNTEYFFPDETDKAEAVRRVEAGFLVFLKNEFYQRSGSEYWVLEENGVWLSALRTSVTEPGLYYIEALETRPDSRKKGCASRLIAEVVEALKKEGPFRLCCCVSKKNAASLNTHLKCGFEIVSEEGYDYLLGESDSRDYGLEYRFGASSGPKPADSGSIDISKLCGRYDIRRMTDADADEILEFCSKNTLYYQYCGAEPTKESILSDLHITPPGVDDADKYYVGFFREAELAAVMDLIDGYPSPDVCYIGFFMMNAAMQGKRIGSGIIGDVCAYLKELGRSAVRLGIAEDNPQANHFWKKNGFAIIDRKQMEGWTAVVAERKL